MNREHFAVALSLANLIFLRSWAELLRLREAGAAGTPAGRALLCATLLNVLALSSLLLLGRWAAGRLGDRRLTAARCALLVLVVTPIDYLDWHLRPWAQQFVPQIIFVVLWTGLMMVPLFGSLVLALYGKQTIYRAVRALLLITAPLAGVLTATQTWSSFGPGSKPIIPQLAGAVPSPRQERLIWIVFDEFDYNLAFKSRPQGIEMPELDRLRSESFFAHAALPPANDTMESMASYLFGRPVAKFEPMAPRYEARIASGELVALANQPDVTSEARRYGVDTFVVGWWLPYCELLSGHLTGCVNASVAAVRPSGILDSLAGQWSYLFQEHWLMTRFSPEAQLRAPWFGWDLRMDQYMGYELLHKESLRVVTGSGGRFALLHYPIPHPLGIYDRRENRLSLGTHTNSIDNLELVDRTLRELRRAMEEAGVWDQTNLIVTSDHPLRPDEWIKFDSWTEEERRLTGNIQRETVPCLIKIAGSKSRLESDRRFSTIALSSLSLELLQGRIRSVSELDGFLAGTPGDRLTRLGQSASNH